MLLVMPWFSLTFFRCALPPGLGKNGRAERAGDHLMGVSQGNVSGRGNNFVFVTAGCWIGLVRASIGWVRVQAAAHRTQVLAAKKSEQLFEVKETGFLLLARAKGELG
ncbi:hypothetical protein J3F84DRAFT_370164 [Trichoderma pleuroticola]